MSRISVTYLGYYEAAKESGEYDIMSEKLFLIIKGDAVYNVLRAAADEMKEAFVRWGYLPVELDLAQYDLSRKEDADRLRAILFQPYAFIFSFQALMTNLRIGERSILEYLQAPFICWLVDHPLFHTDRLQEIGGAENVLVMAIEGRHISYIQNFHPYIRNMAHVPLAGFEAAHMPLEKDIDVFFSGTYRQPAMAMKEIEAFPAAYRTVMLGAVTHMLADELLTVEDAFCEYFEKIGFTYTADDIVVMHDILGWVDLYVRDYYRDKGIRELIEAGIYVTVVGKGWDTMELPEGKKEYLIILKDGSMDITETIETTARAKICLNLMSSYRFGMHERIPTAMLNHAVCVTMHSDYLAEQFEEDKEIVFYPLKEEGRLAEKVRFLLENKSHREEIARRAYEKAKQDHTWECRARDIRDVVENGI